MKKIPLIISLLVICSLLLGACAPKPQNSSDTEIGTIAISGAFALYPMMTRWAEEYQVLHPGVVFDISAGGAGKGMTDVLSGAVEIGMISREVNDDEIAQGAYKIPVTKDAVFPVVNASNPAINALLVRGIDQATFTKIFISGEITSWGQVLGDPTNTDAIHVYTRSDACGAAETWANYLGGNQEDLLGIGVSGDPGLLDAVIKDPLGIGYNNLNYAYDMNTGLPVSGAVVLPIDINQNGKADVEELYQTKLEALKAVAEDIYPSPPARLLYLVTNGRPTGIVQTFIKWILIDGQVFVEEAGYIQLPNWQLGDAYKRIK
jgi:phosphate transport system substrate-binding protein